MSDKNALEVVKEKINGVLVKYPVVDEPLTKLSEKVKVDKAFVVLAIAAVPLLLCLALGNAHVLIDLAAFIYPVYASIKAIESANKEDDTQWLTYWLIFALFKIVEGILPDYYTQKIPFYFLLKVAFLVWCYYPTTKGASVLYSMVIKPYVVPQLGFDESAGAEKKKDK